MLLSYPLLCYYFTRIFCYLRPTVEKNLNFVNDRIDLLKYMNVKVLSGDITGRVIKYHEYLDLIKVNSTGEKAGKIMN